ncbi:MAG: DUF3800 domain-containing protein [Candidatus Beckwithbacteria bacterium]
MLVFIDESGDAGFKVQKGSTAFFVITLIVFKEEIHAEETALAIKKLRIKLKKSDKFEFKFNKCNKRIRTQFLEEVKKNDFKIRAIVINKNLIYKTFLRINKEKFYNFVLRQVLEHNNETIKNAKVRLDGLGEKAFKKELSTYLRQYLNSKTKKIMKNLRFRDSKKDVLIQLADMIAGSLRRDFEHNTNDWNVYRKIIKNKEEDIWEFK